MAWDAATAIAGIFAAAGQLVAAVVAVRALATWREQRRAEVAERALAVAYRLREVFRQVRSPFGVGVHVKERQPVKGERPEDKGILDGVHEIEEGFRFYRDEFNQAAALRLDLRARGENQAAAAIEEILKCRKDVWVAGDLLVRSQLRMDYTGPSPTYQKRFEAFEALRWDADDDDVLMPRIDHAIKVLEDHAEQSRSSSWGRAAEQFVLWLRSLDRHECCCRDEQVQAQRKQ